MAFIVPKNIPTPLSGDTSYWEGYELLESLTADGPGVHQALINDRLTEMKTNTDIPVTINAVTTRVFLSETPMPEQRYFTTICYSVLGAPNTFPTP